MSNQPTLLHRAAHLYRTVVWGLSSLQSVVLLLLRLWGWQFMVDGWGKLNNHAKVAEFFADLHIPMPGLNAWVVGGVECFGGILLLVGLFSRPVALILTFNMLMAFLSVPDDRATFFHAFKDPDAFIAASPFFYLLVSVIVLVFGPGLFSLDALLARLLCRQLGAQPMLSAFPVVTS